MKMIIEQKETYVEGVEIENGNIITEFKPDTPKEKERLKKLEGIIKAVNEFDNNLKFHNKLTYDDTIIDENANYESFSYKDEFLNMVENEKRILEEKDKEERERKERERKAEMVRKLKEAAAKALKQEQERKAEAARKKAEEEEERLRLEREKIERERQLEEERKKAEEEEKERQRLEKERIEREKLEKLEEKRKQLEMARNNYKQRMRKKLQERIGTNNIKYVRSHVYYGGN